MTVLLNVTFASALMNPQWPWSPVKRSVQELAANIPVRIAIETPPPAEELLAPDDCLEKESVFFRNGSLVDDGAPVDGLTPVHT